MKNLGRKTNRETREAKEDKDKGMVAKHTIEGIFNMNTKSSKNQGVQNP